MTDSRTAEVNRALSQRRALMNKRIRMGRILLTCWMIFAALNLVLLFGNVRYRLPLSCTTADFLMMMRFLYPDRGELAILVPLAMLIPPMLLLIILWWKRYGVLRTVAFLLLWVDVIFVVATWLWNPAILFGDSGIRHFIAISNLLLHFLLIWHISRARRAVSSLEILPETEYDGDPYEEFRKNRQENDQ